MREIKFRAWDKKKKKWLKAGQSLLGYLVAWKSETKFEILGRGDYEIMQCTGLYDKNGKEVYEGDIVECFQFDDSDFRSKVTYKNGAFGYMSPCFDMFIGFESNNNFKWHNGKSDRIKVIGNIYENPELLESEGK